MDLWQAFLIFIEDFSRLYVLEEISTLIEMNLFLVGFNKSKLIL